MLCETAPYRIINKTASCPSKFSLQTRVEPESCRRREWKPPSPFFYFPQKGECSVRLFSRTLTHSVRHLFTALTGGKQIKWRVISFVSSAQHDIVLLNVCRLLLYQCISSGWNAKTYPAALSWVNCPESIDSVWLKVSNFDLVCVVLRPLVLHHQLNNQSDERRGNTGTQTVISHLMLLDGSLCFVLHAK